MTGNKQYTTSSASGLGKVVVAAIVLCLAGCEQEPSTLNSAISHYRRHQLQEALPLFERAVTESPSDATTHAWLAETYRRLGRTDDATAEAETATRLDSCNTFALTVMAELHLPLPWDKRNDTDSCWLLLDRALACDATDGGVWITRWGEAICRNRPLVADTCERKLVETGFLTGAALEYGRWMLRALPEDAILITNGDMDTYPPLGLQQTEELRDDVLVVERGLLNLAPYLRWLASEHHLPLPIDTALVDSVTADGGAYAMTPTLAETVFEHWVSLKKAGELGRPLAVAITVAPDFYASESGVFQMCGPFLLWQPSAATVTLDTALCRLSLERIEADAFAGPWASDQDHSSVRHAYTYRLLGNVTETAVLYCEALLQADRREEAAAWLDWVERVEANSQLGTLSSDRTTALRSRL